MEYVYHEDTHRSVAIWKNMKHVVVRADEFNRIVDSLASSGAREVLRSRYNDMVWGSARRVQVYAGKWYRIVDKGRGIIYDCTFTITDYPCVYQWNINTNSFDQEKQDEKATGLESYSEINQIYRMCRGIKNGSIFTGFSARKYETIYTKIKKCVPTQINYGNRMFVNRNITNVYKADVSSAFPSQLVNHLIPTLEGYKVVKGRVDPTPEYPFAFYTKSHHLSIYGEFSTVDDLDMMQVFYRKYLNHNDPQSMVYDTRVKPDDDETVLCKAGSRINMQGVWDTFTYLYNHRKDFPEMKQYMVAAIGYFQKNSNPNLSHIAAVTIARCNHMIYQHIRKLIDEGNIILLVATDSVAWKGKPYAGATGDKYLGSFTYEGYDTKLFMQGCKSYQFYDVEGNLITKAAGIPQDISGKYSYGELPTVKATQHSMVGDAATGRIVIMGDYDNEKDLH